MPLPLGHAAIGLITHDLNPRNNPALSRWKVAVFILVLANLPDIDVIVGLLFQGNGHAFHRGPTHSVVFAILTGFLVSVVCKLWSYFPKITFMNCFLIILSHVVADLLFTSSPVSFFWPLEVNWSTGCGSWLDVMNSVFLKPFQNAEIVMGCAVVLILNRLVRTYSNIAGKIAKNFLGFLKVKPFRS